MTPMMKIKNKFNWGEHDDERKPDGYGVLCLLVIIISLIIAHLVQG